IESIDAIRRIWAGNDASFDGNFYDFEGIDVSPKAENARICIGGGVEPAVRRAGRIGDAWVAHPGETNEDLQGKTEWFEEGGGGDLIVRRD
ncbi:LLM class flavin-dependent oxidoreductase, partial [Aeromonas veronii]|uniref:LLM class flavin-dependent oxidoreductase n=1 Tax=Aeromonas veronii TaxID=654 RepID=UPI0038B5DEB1